MLLEQDQNVNMEVLTLEIIALGANAVILGPVELGNGINIGASALVIKDCKMDNVTLIGVPAKIYQNV